MQALQALLRKAARWPAGRKTRAADRSSCSIRRPDHEMTLEIRRLDTGPHEVSPVAAGTLLRADGAEPALWQVAEEMPVAILLNGETFAVMMATPADLEDFAVGFALTEGIADRAEAIDGLRIAEAADGLLINLALDPARLEAVAHRRRTQPAAPAAASARPEHRGGAASPAPAAGPEAGPAAMRAAFDALPAAQ